LASLTSCSPTRRPSLGLDSSRLGVYAEQRTRLQRLGSAPFPAFARFPKDPIIPPYNLPANATQMGLLDEAKGMAAAKPTAAGDAKTSKKTNGFC